MYILMYPTLYLISIYYLYVFLCFWPPYVYWFHWNTNFMKTGTWNTVFQLDARQCLWCSERSLSQQWGKAFQAGERMRIEWIKQSRAQCSESRVSLKNNSVGQMKMLTCYRLLTFSAQHLGLCILLWRLHWLTQQFGKVIWVIYLLFCFYVLSLCWEWSKEPRMKIERSVKSLFDDSLLIFLVRK